MAENVVSGVTLSSGLFAPKYVAGVDQCAGNI